ncbi:RHS repeat protein, partial [Legionella fairfieldensis]|uniref:RHS repeat protein n=1 Tax=Legionella fairfieldensis TaxID=45064 RepID=UPI00146FC122
MSETAYDYDEGGQLTAVRDRDGHCLALSYEEGHLVRVVDSSGEQRIEWRFERGVLQEITTWSEASVVHHLRYEYDAQGRLCRVSRDLGQGLTFWVTYAYWGESTRLRELRESDGVALLLDYDASGRLIRLTDGEGRWTQYRYEAGHTVISNALGETSTYGYDAQGRLTRVVDGVGHAIDYVYEGARLAAIYQGDLQWRFAYNDAGDCVDRVLPSGERIRCTYDSDHRVLSETHVADGWGVRTSYRVYDERGHVRFKVALDGTVSECCYNEQGQLLRVRTYLKAGLTGQSPASSLSLSAMTRWAASQPPEAVSLVDYRYDWRGLLAEEVHYAAIDPAGNGVLAGALTTSYRYNAAGLLVEKGQPVAGGIRLTHYLYDDLGRLLETRDSEGHSERVVYDEAHRQVITTDARGVRTIRTYDRTGLLLATQVMESTGVSYGTTTYRYDEAGRLVRTGHADGTFTVYCYDAAGHLLAQCEPGGRVCEYTYDALGRVVQTVQRAGVVTADWSADSLTWAAIRPAADRGDRLRQTIYNACNQVAYTVDEAGGVIGFDYDAAGQVVRKTAYATRITLQEDVLLTVDTLLLVASEDDRISRYRYDEAGRLQAEVNGNGAVTGYTWDREGHCLDVCRYATALTGLYSLDWALPPPSPKDSHTYSRYNAAGLKVADIDALGYVTTYAYNEQGLVCEKRVVSQAIGIRRLEEGAALETLLRLSAADHVTTYRYDGLNRLIEQTDPNHRVTRYRYDERGQVVESTCLDARSQAYRGTACRYDALGRVIQQLNATGAALLRDSPGLSAAEQEAIWAAHSVQLSYDALGRLLSQRNARQETTQFFYNEAGLLQYTVTADGEVVEQAYNGFQEVIATRRYSNRLPGLLVGLTASGLAARLSELRDEAHDEVTTYAYHPTGLLASKTVGGHQETTVLYNAFGEVASTRQRLDADQVYQTTYRYDHQGLLRHRIEEGEGLYRDSETQYDVWGRVSKAIDARQGETTYRVNARGECTLIENAVHSSKTMSYDAFGRVVSESALVAKAYTYDDETNTVTIRHVGEDTTTILQFNAFGDKVCLDDNGAVTTWCYDENGQLLAVEKPEGQGMAYRYDEAGHLVWQQDNEGRVIVYTYDATGRVLTKIIDPEGLALTTTYRYDGIGRQLQVVEADGLCKRFTYNAAGQLQQTCIDPEGLQLRTDFVYDERGLLVRQVEHLDAQRTRVTAYEWDALGRCVATIRDAEGLKLTTRTGYDANNNRVWETDANQHTRHWVYDANNRCRYEVDARGVVTAHHYDSRDNECKTVVYAHRLSRVDNYTQAGIEALLKPDEQDCYQFRTFDRAGRVRLVFDALGYATRYVYDVKGNVVSQVRYAQAFSLARLKEGYAPEPRDETNARVTYMAYDGLNQLRYRVDAQGAVTSFHYNRAGQVSQTTRFYVGLPLQQMKRDFSCAGIEAKLTLHADQDQTTRYAYDKAGRLVYQLSPEGAVTRYDYDGASRRIATCQYATRLNPTGLDAQWPERVMASTADRLTRFVFDAAGRERYRISAEGRVLERCYDAVGNVVAEVRHTWRLADGAPLSKDALEDDKGAQRTRWTYDTLGRLVQKTDAAGGQTAYTYDGNNNVITQTDARQARWTYGYDEANQLVETRSPEVSVTGEAAGQWVSETRAILTRHTYDSFGNVVETVRDAEGLMARRVYVYDALNRCVETRYPDVRVDASGTTACAQRNEVVQTLTEVNRYNAFGEVVAKQDRAGYWSYTAYNGRGEVLYTLGADGELTGCEYDGLGRLTGKTRYATRLSLEALGGDYSAEAFARGRCVSADDRQERCEYDRENRLVKVRQAALRSYNGATRQYARAEPTRRFTYNAFGEVIEEQVCRQAGEWATTRFQYDRDGLKVATLDAGHYLTTWSYNALGETEAERAYAQRAEVGANGEWTRPPVAAEDRWVVFAYDALSRLTAKTFKQVSHARLTADGRRYETLTGEVTTTYTYDALDHLTSTTDTMGYRSFCYYDALGQLIAKVGPATAAGQRAVSYGYDGLGQLVETTRFAEGAAAADETTFRLRGKSAKDQTTHSLYDAEGRLLAEVDGLQHAVYYSYDGRGQVTRRWQSLTGVDGTLQRRDQRYRYDEAGSLLQTATLTEAGSLITEDACYNAFGEVIAKGRNGRFTTHMDYDTAGRVWRSNSAGFYQIYVYDLTDKVTQVVTSTQAFNGQWGEEGLDLSTGMASDTLSFSDGAWRYGLTRQDTVYDALGHLMSKRKESVVRGTTHEDRLQAVEEVETTDRWGNVLSHTSARGLTTRMRYNAFDQVVEQVLPPVEVCNERGERQWLAPTVRYAYDALGRALAVTDANGHTVAKLLDAEGQVLADIDAKGNRRVKTYDLFGNRVSSRTERGALTTYVYDKANRLIELKTATGSQRSQYDEAGQLVAQTDALGAHRRVWYDTMGQRIAQEDQGRVTQYAYDDAGHQVLERDAQGHTRTWAYNEAGQLIRHGDLGGHVTTYRYNRNGLLLEEVSTAGKHLQYHYQGDGALMQYVDNVHHETVDYAYDQDGNVVAKTASRTVQGPDDGWLREMDVYAYDALGRLVTVRRRSPQDTDSRFPDKDHALLNIDYQYDAVGNIRHTQVMANYSGFQPLVGDEYYTYDETNR